MFTVRWRWNASRALAVPRFRGGKKTPAPLQRMESENLLGAVFPDQLACLEHIVGDREVPDHPLVNQTISDCLTEAMDIEGLEAVLRKIETGQVRCIARDLPEPSPLAAEILSARPYAFLDNAPLEERRTQAVYTRRASESAGSDGLGVLGKEEGFAAYRMTLISMRRSKRRSRLAGFPRRCDLTTDKTSLALENLAGSQAGVPLKCHHMIVTLRSSPASIASPCSATA